MSIEKTGPGSAGEESSGAGRLDILERGNHEKYDDSWTWRTPGAGSSVCIWLAFRPATIHLRKKPQRTLACRPIDDYLWCDVAAYAYSSRAEGLSAHDPAAQSADGCRPRAPTQHLLVGDCRSLVMADDYGLVQTRLSFAGCQRTCAVLGMMWCSMSAYLSLHACPYLRARPRASR